MTVARLPTTWGAAYYNVLRRQDFPTSNVSRLRHAMCMRPALKVGLRPLWRDKGTLQLGIDPRRARALHADLGKALGVVSLLDKLVVERVLKPVILRMNAPAPDARSGATATPFEPQVEGDQVTYEPTAEAPDAEDIDSPFEPHH